MAISDTINSMKEHVQAAYSQVESMNGTVPTKKNLENLAGAIGTIKTGVDTSDATAMANDILLGKTAYARGEKITGSIETYAGDGSETVNKLASLVDGTLTEITAEDLAGATKIKGSVFSYCSALTSITIPDSVTSIGNYAFMSCTSLTNITIPNSVTSIGESVFRSCSSLTNITLSAGITIININLFEGCSSLSSITIPNKVTKILAGALIIGSSYNKATITMLPTTPPTIQYNTFMADYLQKIIVPAGTGATYKAATNWSNFADYIEEATA